MVGESETSQQVFASDKRRLSASLDVQLQLPLASGKGLKQRLSKIRQFGTG